MLAELNEAGARNRSQSKVGGKMVSKVQGNFELRMEEKNKIIEKIKPVIEYALLQTNPQHRDDLRQHLYEMVMKILKNIEFSEPRGLFN